MTKFSIIIPVRQINDFLKENILHLKNLNYLDFEVLIIVDNPEVYDFGGDARFNILASGAVSPGEKRNLGAKECNGEILAFLDDDAYPSEEWLNEASKFFKDPTVYALAGPAVTPLKAPFLERLSGNVSESMLTSSAYIYRYIPQKERQIDDYPTVNLLVKKDAFWAVGGFSGDFWPGEDTKLCLDLVEKYGKFTYSPMPVVYHHRRKLFKPYLKQISRYGTHRGMFARIFPETSRLPGYFIPSLFVLGLVIGSLASLYIPFLWKPYLLVLLIYILLLIAEGLRVFKKEKTIKAFGYFVAGVFLTHLVYGFNFILGFIMKPRLKLKSVDTRSGNYLEG